jgi:uncharacterized protein (TIGR02722 family)
MMVAVNAKSKFLLPLFCLMLGISACGPKLVQERVDPDLDITFNTRWNDIDSHEAAWTMIESCLHSHWLDRFMALNDNHRPIVIVDQIENRTDEHIDTEALTNEIRTALIQSGDVRFLDAKARDSLLKEYHYQASGVVRPDLAKGPGQQLSSDFIMTGELSSISSELDKNKLVTYQIDLRMTNLLTSEIEWADVYRIKKVYERKHYKP